MAKFLSMKDRSGISVLINLDKVTAVYEITGEIDDAGRPVKYAMFETENDEIRVDASFSEVIENLVNRGLM